MHATFFEYFHVHRGINIYKSGTGVVSNKAGQAFLLKGHIKAYNNFFYIPAVPMTYLF